VVRGALNKRSSSGDLPPFYTLSVSVHDDAPARLANAIVGPYRTLTQDVSFGIDQLSRSACVPFPPRSTTPLPR
jgi:uncharacterized membrane protein